MGNTVRVIGKTRNIEESLGKILNEQRKQGKYCDFILKTENGDEFPMHKIILESISEFFEKLFNNDFQDSKKPEFIVHNCSSDILKKIIDFMYTNEIDLSSTTIKEILNVASFLQLKNLVQICIEYLLDNCNKENCFELLDLSESFEYGEKLLKSLTKKSIEVIYENLVELVKKDLKKFQEISFESLYSLLMYARNENLHENTNNEKSTCENSGNRAKLIKNYNKEFYIIITNWVQYDIEYRQQFLITLLKKSILIKLILTIV